MDTKNWCYKKYLLITLHFFLSLSFFPFSLSSSLFWGKGVKFEAQGGAYMVLIFLAILRLAVLIDVVLIRKSVYQN